MQPILSQGHDSIERMIGCAVGELLSGLEKVLKDLDPEALERAGVAGAVRRLPPHRAAGGGGQGPVRPADGGVPGLVLQRASLALSPHGRGHRLLGAPCRRPAGGGRGHASAAGHRGRSSAPGPSPSARRSRWRPRRWPIRPRRRSCWSWPRSSRSSSCNGRRPGCGRRPPTTTNATAGPIAGATSGTGSTSRARSASPAASPPRRAPSCWPAWSPTARPSPGGRPNPTRASAGGGTPMRRWRPTPWSRWPVTPPARSRAIRCGRRRRR